MLKQENIDGKDKSIFFTGKTCRSLWAGRIAVLFQVSPVFAGVFQADGQSVAQTAVEAGRVLQGSNSGDAARQLLTSRASGQAADAVTQWLNQFGTAKAQLSVDSDFSLKGSSLDVLLPFYNTPKRAVHPARDAG